MLKRAVESGIPFGWVTADWLYGQTSRIRIWLEEHDIARVLAVPKSQTDGPSAATNDSSNSPYRKRSHVRSLARCQAWSDGSLLFRPRLCTHAAPSTPEEPWRLTPGRGLRADMTGSASSLSV
ncbi:hypothetical protein OG949_40670 (plasmid) [Streptomyces scopuliridis]|uniref:hypothetical protein n=1 Tax=Streptomyces scopuliridis TaxID=452529 RepID=UPI002DDAA5DF|nr:hypothetical protein [Streptomyces scopuliridis]WSB39069.1 hypothetical protein OG949_40670 [Streptomyces scopuliridis]